MSDYLRILDRYKISGREPVYIVSHNRDAVIHLGDIFADLQGNRFQIESVEMDHRIPEAGNYGNLSAGLMFTPLDGVEIHGTLLIREHQKLNFLFCSHPLYPRRVDDDFADEFKEASRGHASALFSYENLLNGKLSLHGESISGITIYRGWMLKPEVYRLLYKLLEEKDIILVNSPEKYERYHLLPGWYNDFKGLTPESVWESEGNADHAMQLAQALKGPYIVKDFVKSRKHEWYSACYIDNIADREQATNVIRTFVHRQGSDLVGGIVLRRFEKLKQIGFHEKSGMPISEEYRVFIFAGRVLTIDSYWCEGEEVSFSASEQKWIEETAARVKSNFVTMDLARKENGEFIIMEFGDGQVSGLQQIKPEHFYARFEHNESTWSEYKEYVKTVDADAAHDLDEAEKAATIVTSRLKQHNTSGANPLPSAGSESRATSESQQ